MFKGQWIFFSGLVDIILDRFQELQWVLIMFSKLAYLKGSSFALGVKASRVLAIRIFLFSLFDCFSFSIFWDDFVCVLACIVQLMCWSDRVLLSASFNSLNCISGLILLCFLFLKLFFFDKAFKFLSIKHETKDCIAKNQIPTPA